jgi:hypothetical protein
MRRRMLCRIELIDASDKSHTGFVRWRIQFNPSIAAWLLDHFIRSRQHIRRNREADLLRSSMIVPKCDGFVV